MQELCRKLQHSSDHCLCAAGQPLAYLHSLTGDMAFPAVHCSTTAAGSSPMVSSGSSPDLSTGKLCVADCLQCNCPAPVQQQSCL